MIKAPLSVQELRTRIGDKAKAESHHRFWGMYVHVCKTELLLQSYQYAKANDGAAGIDGKDFEQIEEQGLKEFIEQIAADLRTKEYRPLPCRSVLIPKGDGKQRELKIPAIRDRVVQGALKLIMEPVFEADFQPGSFGYRPSKSAHQALEYVSAGLNKMLYHVLDFDLEAYFDSVRHDILLEKIAKRFADDDILWLCKRILTSSGRKGIAQGSVLGPLLANLYLNDVDRMLERAGEVTREGKYERIRYARYADDMVVLISTQPFAAHWQAKAEQRLREELAKLRLTINEEKSKKVRLDKGESFDFLGYTFRLGFSRKNPTRKVALSRPQKKRRTQFLRGIRTVLNRSGHIPVKEVITKRINPKIQGWVNYFRWGNAGRDLSFVQWQIDKKIRKFATRQNPKRKGGCSWTKWSRTTLYVDWGLYNQYQVMWRAAGA